MSVPDIELSISYMPGNEVHEKLIKATEDGKRVQLKIAYYIDATKNLVYISLITASCLKLP